MKEKIKVHIDLFFLFFFLLPWDFLSVFFFFYAFYWIGKKQQQQQQQQKIHLPTHFISFKLKNVYLLCLWFLFFLRFCFCFCYCLPFITTPQEYLEYIYFLESIMIFLLSNVSETFSNFRNIFFITRSSQTSFFTLLLLSVFYKKVLNY